MTIRIFAIALLLMASALMPEGPQPVVLKLYRQVVARRPLGIPQGQNKAAIDPFLSRTLVQRLKTAQACEDHYFRQHPPEKDAKSKPEFPWLDLGIFSGPNEEASPSAAEVISTQPQADGFYGVLVRLTYKESYETYGRPPDPANTSHWEVAAVVKSEKGRFVVDDVLFFDENAKKIEWRLSEFFTGCDGPVVSGRRTRVVNEGRKWHPFSSGSATLSAS